MKDALTDLMSEESIDRMRRPIEEAWTFPARAFSDPAFLALEKEKIYQRRWVAVLYDFDVANPGDVFPFELLGMPMFCARAQDNRLRVFHNICPYDGAPIVTKRAQGCQNLVVNYHGWIYSLEGKLLAAPHWNGGSELDMPSRPRGEIDLHEVATEVFMRTVFINLGSAPEPFEEFLAPLLGALEEYDLERASIALDATGKPYTGETRVASNWKTFFENACVNVLHESFVHELYQASTEVPRVTGDGTRTWVDITDEAFLALAYDAADFEHTYPSLETPHLGRDPASPPTKEFFGTLYPNFYFCASAQAIEVSYVLPEAVDRVFSRVSYYLEEGVAVDPAKLDQRRIIIDMFHEAFVEDQHIVETIQRGRESPAFQQKFYAPFWDKMHFYLNGLILDDLQT